MAKYINMDESYKRHIFSFSNIFSVIATATGVIALFLTICQNKEISRVTYLQDASSKQPRLELVKPLDSLNFEMEPVGDLTKIPGKNMSSIPVRYSINGKIGFVNLGNTTAHEIMHATGDTFDDHAIIRNQILSKQGRREISNYLRDDKTFLKNTRIAPFDTFYENINKLLYHVYQDSMCLIHVYILYQNESGALFDTYYWMKINLRSPILPITPVIKDDRLAIMIKYLPGDFGDLTQDRLDSRIYTLDEKNEIMDWIEKIDKDST